MTKKAAKRPAKKKVTMEGANETLANGQENVNDEDLLNDMESIVTKIRNKLAFHREGVNKYTNMLAKLGLSPGASTPSEGIPFIRKRSRGHDSCKGRVLEAIKLGKTSRKEIGDFVLPFGFTPSTLNVTLYTMAKKGEVRHNKANHTYQV